MRKEKRRSNWCIDRKKGRKRESTCKWFIGRGRETGRETVGAV